MPNTCFDGLYQTVLADDILHLTFNSDYSAPSAPFPRHLV